MFILLIKTTLQQCNDNKKPEGIPHTGLWIGPLIGFCSHFLFILKSPFCVHLLLIGNFLSINFFSSLVFLSLLLYFVHIQVFQCYVYWIQSMKKKQKKDFWMSSLKFVDSVSVLNDHERMTKIQSVTANSLREENVEKPRKFVKHWNDVEIFAMSRERVIFFMLEAFF